MSLRKATSAPRKSVLITGCSPGGIGHALAREFHSKGLHVIATARNRDSIKDLEDQGMSTISLEVTSSESIRNAKKELEALTDGRLDILVNNAGRNCTMPALEVPLDDARDCFEANFFGVIAVTQCFAPFLIAAKGTIVNIGSVAAIFPFVFGSVYNASKAALHSYSHSLRLELKPYDVRVLVVITGGVKSNIARTHRTLPKDSLYLEINDEFNKRLVRSQDGAMDNEVYAKGVVKEALKPAKTQKKVLWRGNKTFLIWFVSSFVGSWLFDLMVFKIFGLDRLKRIVSARRG